MSVHDNMLRALSEQLAATTDSEMQRLLRMTIGMTSLLASNREVIDAMHDALQSVEVADDHAQRIADALRAHMAVVEQVSGQNNVDCLRVDRG